jgi:hypothetical protein
MIVVFTSFVLDTDPTVKMLAIGMAFAVLIDASLVRMVLVPSVMTLLGSAAWWMPRWLEPIVPRLQLEGSTAAAAAREPASPDEQHAGTAEPPPSWDSPSTSVPGPRRRKDEEVKANAPQGTRISQSPPADRRPHPEMPDDDNSQRRQADQ